MKQLNYHLNSKTLTILKSTVKFLINPLSNGITFPWSRSVTVRENNESNNDRRRIKHGDADRRRCQGCACVQHRYHQRDEV